MAATFRKITKTCPRSNLMLAHKKPMRRTEYAFQQETLSKGVKHPRDEELT
jgi:hypothetical protein